MVDDKCQDDEAAHEHCPGRVRRSDRLIHSVFDRTRGFVLDRELCRRPNVEHEQRDKNHARGPKQLQVFLEKVTVAVNRLRTKEDLQVARQVRDDEQEQHATGHGHDVFPAK